MKAFNDLADFDAAEIQELLAAGETTARFAGTSRARG